MLSQNSRSTQLLRWGGWALLFAGVLTIVAILLHPDEGVHPEAVLLASWLPIHLTFIVSILLAFFGLTALYIRQKEASGTLGLLGYLLTMVGNALFIGVLTIDTFIVPALAADPATARLLDDRGPLFGGPLGIIFILTGVIFALGLILLGLSTFRASVLPRYAGFVLMLGVLLAFSPPLPHICGLVGALGLGISYVWMGYALGRETVPTTQLKPAMA